MKKAIISLSVLFFVCFLGNTATFAVPSLAGTTWTGSGTGAVATGGFGTATMTVKINKQSDSLIIGKIIVTDDEGKKKWSFAASMDGTQINGVAIRTAEDGTTRNAIITCTYDDTTTTTLTGIFQNVTKGKIAEFTVTKN